MRRTLVNLVVPVASILALLGLCQQLRAKGMLERAYIQSMDAAIAIHTKSMPLSDQWRLVLFDLQSLEDSPAQKAWTPRATLAKALDILVMAGARVIIVDIWPEKNTPLVLSDNEMVNDHKILLEMLQNTAIKAASGKQRIIFITPHDTLAEIPQSPILHILLQHPDSLTLGSASSNKTIFDNRVRSTRLITESKDLLPSAAWQAWQFWNSTSPSAPASVPNLKTNLCLPICWSFLPRELQKKAGLKKTVGAMHSLSIGQLLRWEPDKLGVKDKVVILGNPDIEFGDHHESIFGSLPGCYLVSNVLNMLFTGHGSAPGPYVFWVLNVSIILVFIYIAFFLFHSKIRPVCLLVVTGLVWGVEYLSMELFNTTHILLLFSLPVSCAALCVVFFQLKLWYETVKKEYTLDRGSSA